MTDVLKGYAEAATPELISRFDNLDCREVYAPVLDLLPIRPVRIADIGAGTGRDAAWFASQGHEVLAVEPVSELREPGMRLHASERIRWLSDSLPVLDKTLTHAPFDLITLCGVWHHIEIEQRQLALEVLTRMMEEGGLLIMSLRHGPSPAGRPSYPIRPDEAIAQAKKAGLGLIRALETDSIQAGNRASGVTWTWIVLKKIHTKT
ncbi:class I SAM-dependent methyltransferase [Agrobacterium cavarae]|uniref:Class I SAM-dependent methyltransferase n=1 Tax=Agrobacterium cavarae TaxID=2528239 RepID=A0ABY1Y3D5_9HYPH|nr:class I SAM-dependent methyltransferase [Agrobacterium cavarae]TBN09312.1 class I SAM-dependent methyltransferase [Agrobacterium cavarae]